MKLFLYNSFVAIEWCICSVEDLYRRDKNGKIPQNNWAGEKIDVDIIKNSLKKKELLRQATEGLAFLHALGFVHRNLKPSNFMIAQLQGFRYLVKLSDFRMSKDPVKYPVVSTTTGSNGWTYPKPAPVNTKVDPSSYFSGDVFILGCFFHYVLTDGQHPFGDKHERESNMKNYDYYVDGYGWKLDQIEDKRAVTLLKDMIKFNLEKICTLDQVLGSRYFLPVNFYNLYDLPGIKPGLCVIFNQEIFDNV
jgi:serine/threonine protein kinase